MEIDTSHSQTPIATVDLVILALADDGLDVLLMKRGTPPFAGCWALPGGFVHPDEDRDLEAAARRVLRDKTGVETSYLEQVQSFGNARRDPRGWSISIVYMALISASHITLRHGANAEDAAWWPAKKALNELQLGFDHPAILQAAIQRIRNKVEYSTLPAHLLAETFTLGELQMVYQRILGRDLDKSAFRKRIAEADFVEPVPGDFRRGSNRPAQLYRLRQPDTTVLFDRTF